MTNGHGQSLLPQDYTEAGLAAAHALELTEGSSEYQDDLARILQNMPAGHAQALEVRH